MKVKAITRCMPAVVASVLSVAQPSYADSMLVCNGQAGGLHGDERKTFMKECLRKRTPEQEAAATAAAELSAARANNPGVRLGMRAEQVMNKTNWGPPDSVNRTITKSGVHEQWVYRSGFLYFENGALTAIQD